MGISEQARNVTDTSLKLVLTTSDDPVQALKRHILKLEASHRDLARSEGSVVNQCRWLSDNIERNLKLAQAEETRAQKLLEHNQEKSARDALRDKRDALRRTTADQRKLTQLENSLPALRDQLRGLRERIDQAKALRTRMTAGENLQESDLHRQTEPTSQSPAPAPERQDLPDEPTLVLDEEKELDRELERLRDRLESRDREDAP